MEATIPMRVTVQVEAVVIRCACGKPGQHKGQVCPKGKREKIDLSRRDRKDKQ